VFADRGADSRIHCVVLGTTRQRRDAPGAVCAVDQGSVSCGSVLHPAHPDGCDHDHPDPAQSGTAGSDTGQGHENHAGGIQYFLFLLPRAPN